MTDLNKVRDELARENCTNDHVKESAWERDQRHFCKGFDAAVEHLSQAGGEFELEIMEKLYAIMDPCKMHPPKVTHDFLREIVKPEIDKLKAVIGAKDLSIKLNHDNNLMLLKKLEDEQSGHNKFETELKAAFAARDVEIEQLRKTSPSANLALQIGKLRDQLAERDAELGKLDGEIKVLRDIFVAKDAEIEKLTAQVEHWKSGYDQALRAYLANYYAQRFADAYQKALEFYADEDNWSEANAQTCPAITRGEDIEVRKDNKCRFTGGKIAREALNKFYLLIKPQSETLEAE